MTDDTVLVCMRVADKPSPPVASDLGRCGFCSEEVWVARSSPPAHHTWCMRCAADEIKKDAEAEFGGVTDKQLADIASYFTRGRQ